jgi:hypothetical protein
MLRGVVASVVLVIVVAACNAKAKADVQVLQAINPGTDRSSVERTLRERDVPFAEQVWNRNVIVAIVKNTESHIIGTKSIKFLYWFNENGKLIKVEQEAVMTYL